MKVQFLIFLISFSTRKFYIIIEIFVEIETTIIYTFQVCRRVHKYTQARRRHDFLYF
jgi:hypothetical protein